MFKILPIQPFRETLYKGYCGPASLKMILQYYGIEKTEAELVKLMGINNDQGTDAEKIQKTAKSFGLKCDLKNNSDFQDIEKYLDQKIPIIANWFTRGRNDYPDSAIADGHYSVVVGLDKNFIYLQDPEIGKIRKIQKDDFKRVWFDFKGKYIRPNELIIRQIIAIYQ